MRRVLAFALLFGLAACSDHPEPITAPEDSHSLRAEFSATSVVDPYVAGRVLARFEPGADAARIASAHGATIDRPLVLGIQVLTVPAGQEFATAEALSRNPGVEFAEPDWIRTFGDPTVVSVDDPYFGYKWDLDNDGQIYSSTGDVLALTGGSDADMDWLEAFEQLDPASGSAVIGIMDTGIRHDHEELTGRIAAEYDFFDGDADAADDYGHGTHVAGITAAGTNNGKGVSGVAFASDVQFAIAKVCGYTNPVMYGCPTSSIAEGITWAVDNGAHVLNLSLGGGSGSSSVQSALQYARTNDVLPFCAAGNDGQNSVSYPAAWPECVAVSATDWSDGLASYSNFGPEIELSAPGGDDENSDGYSYILSTYYDGPDSYAWMAGTSMATPQAAGLAALLHALGTTDDGAKLSAMKNSADDLGASGTDEKFGAGRINVYNAVNGTSGDSNSAPTASYTYACTDLSCDFDGSGSSDSDGSISSYAWDFGDGTTATGATVSHTFDSGGDYTVTLTVTDDEGATDSESKVVSVSSSTNSAPTADFTYSCTDLSCDFTDQSTDSDGSISSWSWDVDGDGSTDYTTQNPSHTYESEGTYTVTLTVTDDDGATDSSAQDVSVSSSSSGSISKITIRVEQKGPNYQAIAEVYAEKGTSVAGDFYLNDAFLNSDSGSVGGKGSVRLESDKKQGLGDSDTFTIEITNPSSGVTTCSVSVSEGTKTCT